MRPDETDLWWSIGYALGRVMMHRMPDDEPRDAARPMGLLLPSSCPKCVASNRERHKAGLVPLPMRFKVRTSDRAIWCFRHDEAFRRYESTDELLALAWAA